MCLRSASLIGNLRNKIVYVVTILSSSVEKITLMDLRICLITKLKIRRIKSYLFIICNTIKQRKIHIRFK